MAATQNQASAHVAAIEFSAHSLQRMAKRKLSFSEQQLTRLQEALKTLVKKGSRTSVVMLDETALIVSVRQHRVVTVVEQSALREQVFTQIDSAVFA
ncbi:MAG: hypothetical protein RBR22_00015 [Desulfuromonas sp.]|nr:hypothetical protein [Desulfuromonas sp.]